MDTQRRVVDIVRNMFPSIIRSNMSGAERDLAILLRDNETLFNALVAMLRARLEGRAKQSVPSDPMKSHTRVVADSELRWLIERLDYLYHSPAVDPVDSRSEPPA